MNEERDRQIEKKLLEKIKLKKFISELKKYRGRHTEFISVYLPPGSDLTKMINQLQQEQHTATNIKDKITSKSVIASLERMIRTMRTIGQTPKNGLAIFSGNVSEKDNVDNFQVFWIEPPEPVPLKLYRCEQRFITEPLEEMVSNDSVYGLIVIDKSEATVGLLEGATIKTIRNMHSSVPGKFKAGGQSAQRFQRIREGAAIEFYKRVADVVTNEFTYMKDLKGIIVGGPGTTKINFVEGNYLNEDLKKKIIGIKDITYTNRYGLQELVDKAQDLLAEEEIATEKRIISKFFNLLSKDINKVTYGYENVMNALKMGAVDELIVVESVIDEKQLEELSKLAQETDAKFELVTNRTPEGKQLEGIGGIAATLRYQIN